MFGDLMGNFQAKQDELKSKLAEIRVTESIQGGAIAVTATGSGLIENISLDPTKMDLSDHEEIEDLLLEAVNKALSVAQQKSEEMSQGVMSEMLPPGLGNLFG